MQQAHAIPPRTLPVSKTKHISVITLLHISVIHFSILVIVIADEEMPKYGSLLREQNVSQRCQAIAFSDMSLCHVDRTYSIKRGCCSKKCSQAFNRVSQSISRNAGCSLLALWCLVGAN
jgi:hypothetical protein